MASIPLPALNIHAPEQPNLLSQVGQAMALKGAQGQQQLQQQQLANEQLQNQQQTMNLQSQKALMKAFQEANGDPDKAVTLAAKYGATPGDVLKLKMAGIEQQKQAIELVSQKGALALQQADAMKGAHDTVAAAPPEAKQQVYAQQVQGLQQMGVDVSQMPPQYPGDEQFKYIGAALQGHKQQVEDAAKQAGILKDTAQANAANAEAQKTGKIVTGMSPNGITADQQATLKQGAQKIAIEGAAQQETVRHNKTQEGMLTPEALTQAAQMFAQTGQMPAMGRDAATRKAIMNEAAKLSPNLDLAGNAAAYKANAASLKGLQENLDSVSAFENTANKNLDLFLQQAKKVVDTGSPFLNTPLRMVDQKLLGDKDMAAFSTARQVAVNEIAKVTSNPGLKGQLSDSARHEVDAFNPENATLAQTYKVAEILKQDMANRHQSYDEQIKAIKQRISPNAASTSAASGSKEVHYKIVNGQLVPE